MYSWGEHRLPLPIAYHHYYVYIYNVVHRPLSAYLPQQVMKNIWRGDYVNLKILLVDHDDDDINDMTAQQRQRFTFEVSSMGKQQTLSLAKNAQPITERLKPLTNGRLHSLCIPWG